MDLESTKLQLEDELEAKTELQKLLLKVQEEIRLSKDRFEKEIESKNEEIEDQRFDHLSRFDLQRTFSFRRKFNGRINEVQEQLTEVLAKASNLEKIKQRLQTELDSLSGEVEKVRRMFKRFSRQIRFPCRIVDELMKRFVVINN